MGVEAGPGVQIARVGGGGGKGNVHGAGLEQAQDLLAAAAGDLQADAGVLPVKGLQIGGQEPAGDRVAGADNQIAHQQLPGLGELVLAGLEQRQGTADIVVEQLPLAGQGDAPGTAGEQTHLQLRLQLLHRLADGRLGDIEIFGGHGDVPRLGHLPENAVQFQLDCHMAPPIPKNHGRRQRSTGERCGGLYLPRL